MPPAKASVSLCSVKAELLGEQEEECKDAKGAGANALANLASQLVEFSYEMGRVVLNKSKVGLSEVCARILSSLVRMHVLG